MSVAGGRGAQKRRRRPAGHHFFDGAVVLIDRAAAGFFFAVFGFFGSRLLRFCPLAMAFLISRAPHRWRPDSMREGWHHVHSGAIFGERSKMSSTEFSNILLERRSPVGIVTLN